MLRIRSLAVAAPLLVVAFQGCHNLKPSQSPIVTPAAAEVTQTRIPPGPLFSFERASDPVSRALVAAYQSYLMAPADQLEYDRNSKALADARRTLRENRTAATALVVGELSRLNSPTNHDRERSLLLWLLAEVGTPAALTTLADVAIAPRPREDFEGTPVIEQAVALAQLRRVAATHDRTAREQILRVVARAQHNPELRRQAIASYYEVSASRFRARREIMAALPVAERYLAHQTF